MMAQQHPDDHAQGGDGSVADRSLATPLDAAQVMTARGWVVFPADHPDASTVCVGLHAPGRPCTDPRKRGKHPAVRWGEIDAPADSRTLAGWFGDERRPRNVAVACGPSGLVVIDEDERDALTRYAARVGAELPTTFRTRTPRGWHWYFRAPLITEGPDAGRPRPMGNAAGRLTRLGMDVRGGPSATHPHGGYVIGAGSVHWSGEVYTAPEPYLDVAELPGWLIEAIEAPLDESAGTGGPPTRWDDQPRYGSADELRAQYRRHLDEVTEPGAAFRWSLFCAALDGWRLVALGLLDEDELLRDLEAVIRRVWSDDPDDRDSVIVFDEARPAAERSPWRLSGGQGIEHTRGRRFGRPSGRQGAGTGPNGSAPRGVQSGHRPMDHGQQDHDDSSPATSGNYGAQPAAERDLSSDVDRIDVPSDAVPNDVGSLVGGGEQALDDQEDHALGVELTRERRRRTVRDMLDAELREPLARPGLRGWLDSTPPSYLVPGMLYRDGLSVVFGAPGSAKSFLALDLALSLATGHPWRGTVLAGRGGGRGTVHYVMAEGQSTNMLRTLAWLHHHERTIDDLDGQFEPITSPVMLTESGVAEYRSMVARDQPDLIILDTKNLMFVGREGAGEDYGAMLRVLHSIRRAAGGCAIVLIDHSGLGNGDRVRGSNAQQGGVDTEVKIVNDEGTRVATVTRDKSAPVGTVEWTFRLAQVDAVPRPAGVAAPAVCVPDDRTPLPRAAVDWWLDELPAEVDELRGRGRAAALDLVRVMRAAGGDRGHTVAELRSMLAEGPREHARSAVAAGLVLLAEAGLTEAGQTAQRVMLVSRLMPPRDA